MQCPYANKCGGCPYRSQTLEAYQKGKRATIGNALSTFSEEKHAVYGYHAANQNPRMGSIQAAENGTQKAILAREIFCRLGNVDEL